VRPRSPRTLGSRPGVELITGGGETAEMGDESRVTARPGDVGTVAGAPDQPGRPGFDPKASAGPTSAGGSLGVPGVPAGVRAERGKPPGPVRPGTASTGPSLLRKGAASSTGGSSPGAPASTLGEVCAGARSGGALCCPKASVAHARTRASDRAVAVRPMEFPLHSPAHRGLDFLNFGPSLRKDSIITVGTIAAAPTLAKRGRLG
jgi:hypothetical protein